MSADNDELARWAADFLATCAQAEPLPAQATIGTENHGITLDALRLLQSVDAGGVPAFMTSALKQIALENGLTFTAQSTPNEVIAALRARCATSTTNDATNVK